MRSSIRGTAAVSALLALATSAAAQDDILVFGNSIVDDFAADYLPDIVVQSGRPAPNLVTFIVGDGDTADFLLNQSLITSSLPAGETWEAVVVQGGTYEISTLFGFHPALFNANMIELAEIVFTHSPQALFIGHETGADHPTSTAVYPSRFPDAETWLGLAQVAYENARVNVTAAFPSNPPMRVAKQGTIFANTAGYPFGLFEGDLHEHSRNGEILDALLWYQSIYGGQLCDLDVDFSSSTPLVNRLVSDGVNAALWKRLVSFADRALEASQRPYPGTDDDFQLRVAVNTGVGLSHLCTESTAMAGDTLRLQPFSPLGAADAQPVGVYVQIEPSSYMPATMGVPAWHLDPARQRLYGSAGDLSGGSMDSVVPAGLSGLSYWVQGVSRTPSGASGFIWALSDAKVVEIL